VSYDVWLTVDLGGREPAVIDGTEWNFTSNIARMLGATGLRIPEFDGVLAGACAARLDVAIRTMTGMPDHFRELEPANGWGSYDQMMPALEKLHDLLKRHPRATVRVYS